MYVKCSALYVGQGAANLIEIYKNKGDQRAAGLILIDFGSAGKKGSTTGGTSGKEDEPNHCFSFDYISDVLYKNTQKLDLLILSHLDEDHINMIPDLIEEKRLSKIDSTIIGGTNRGISDRIHPFTKGSRMKKNVSPLVSKLARAVTGVCGDIRLFTADDGYLDCDQSIYTKKIGGEQFTLKLLANRSTPSVKGASEFINSNSSVTVGEYRGAGKHYAFIFPGDATSDTFRFINRRFKDPKKRAKYTFLNAEKKILIMPHHSALRTACNGEKIKRDIKLEEQLSETKYFADTVCPSCIYASAHYNAKRYFHPNLNSLGVFEKHTEDADSHHVFGFELQMDGGYPQCREKRYKPKYNLKTTDCKKRTYTSHSVQEPISVASASYNGAAAHRITTLSKKHHVFGNLVCEIDQGKINCAYNPL